MRFEPRLLGLKAELARAKEVLMNPHKPWVSTALVTFNELSFEAQHRAEETSSKKRWCQEGTNLRKMR